MITNLLKHIKQSNLILIILTNMMTCDFHENKIIINLIFVFLTVHDWLIHCQVMTKLNKISNYKSIKTFFYFNVRMRETVKYKSWKKTDTEIIKKISNIFWISKHLNFSVKIEQYAVYFLLCSVLNYLFHFDIEVKKCFYWLVIRNFIQFSYYLTMYQLIMNDWKNKNQIYYNFVFMKIICHHVYKND